MKKISTFFFILFLLVCTNTYAQLGNGIDSLNLKTDTVLTIVNKTKLYIVPGTTIKLDKQTEKQVEIVKVKVAPKKENLKNNSSIELAKVKIPKKTEKLDQHLKEFSKKPLVVKNTYTAKSTTLSKGDSSDYPIISQSSNHHDLKSIWINQKEKIGFFYIVNKNIRLKTTAENILNKAINKSLFSRPPPAIA